MQLASTRPLLLLFLLASEHVSSIPRFDTSVKRDRALFFSFASLASLRTQHGARNKNRWWRWRSGGRLSKETRDIYDRFNGREKEAELLLIVLDQRFFCARWRFDEEHVTNISLRFVRYVYRTDI